MDLRSKRLSQDLTRHTSKGSIDSDSIQRLPHYKL